MQGRKIFQPKTFYVASLDALVPQDNLYRRLNSAIDLHYLYAATVNYYGSEGNESIDPVVFFKIMLVGYLNNINSDRKLLEYCSDSLAVRLYLGYDIDEILPWHSTISRTRQLYGEDVFLNLFQQVLQLCVSKGMVRGKRQSVDSAYVKANASMDSLQEKEVLDDAIHYATELNDNSEFKVKASMKKAVEKHHAWKVKEYKGMPGHVDQPKQIDEHGNLIRPKFTSNHTHYSTTDSDARISVKPGKARQLNYSAQLSVDDKHHVITGALADFASKKDSDSLEQIVAQAKENLEQNNITLEEVIADAAYSSGKALKYLAQANIKGWIPNFGQYKSERDGFVYNEDKNQYECQRGNHAILSYKGIKTDSKGYQKHQYRSSESDCSKCTLRAKCCGVVTKYKKIEDSIDKPYYDSMHERLTNNKQYAKRMVRLRSSTVEPVLGTLINFRNMKRVNTRGIRQANKHVLMAAITYNLHKYIRFITQKRKIAVHAIELSTKSVNNSLKMLIKALYILTSTTNTEIAKVSQ
jgi:transposase